MVIIPYSGKAGSGLDHYVDFIVHIAAAHSTHCVHFAICRVGDGRPDAVWFNVFNWT